MPLSQGGDLREAIWRDIREETSEYDWYNKGKDVALAVARGLYFLHRNGVVHRSVQMLRPSGLRVCPQNVVAVPLGLELSVLPRSGFQDRPLCGSKLPD